MRKAAATLASVIVLVHWPQAGAAWNWSQLQDMCAGFLERLRPVGDSTEAEIRIAYNRKALSRAQALLVSNPAVALKSDPDENINWLLSAARASIEMTLDKRMPNWRHTGYWYFQTEADVSLYTENSAHPLKFARDTVILMNGEYAAGEVLDVWNRVELYP